jgi:hypothetical protein
MLFGSNGNSYTVCMQLDMCVHTHILYNMEKLVGQNKFKNGTAVNAVCHFGHACFRFASPELDEF